MLQFPGSQAILVDVKINGRTIRAQMDTGAPHSIITPSAAAAAGLRLDSPDVQAAGVVRGLGVEAIRSQAGTFDTFAFDTETVRNARLVIADMFRANTKVPTGSHLAVPVMDMPDMLLGEDFFRAHRVYVAVGQKRVYVSYVGGPVFEAPPSPAQQPPTRP
jgi:hypothetical protein